MGQHRGKYSDNKLEAAVQAVLAGARMTTVRDDTGFLLLLSGPCCWWRTDVPLTSRLL
ncbi:hypothetical protein PF005_g32846 [Phytophthora fragariae]|uniref:Uncharacterized protein n=1 Tax=Phytophthora fragariae TaxID=53985 RepID=A0A6A3PYD6_9STRA|nr:hypothetical protein PF003_g38284 [Phytophthora fragariae]KAE8888765.1 hypothetical protein PF003_g27380 [Phytophthora fragariae]KAE8893688.1 hypothetical protein PF003_g22070 [Phytophthora fragariae]KAE8897399.1 hypothetical protein PF003_g18354 [Phytophthora fragariae]KAE9054042.1 hypothetical protein PF006_g33367 [Phytophthora fragariae]